MAIHEIPTLTDGETRSYSQRVRLGGVDWLFEFLYSERRDRWTFSILNQAGEYVLTGQLVCCGLGLLQRAVFGPTGQVYALPEDGDLTAPGLTELGTRVKLWWFSPEEL